MTVTYCIFTVGAILFVFSIIQWKLHAEDGWITETWDSDIQEKLYYRCLAPLSAICMIVSLIMLVCT